MTMRPSLAACNVVKTGTYSVLVLLPRHIIALSIYLIAAQRRVYHLENGRIYARQTNPWLASLVTRKKGEGVRVVSARKTVAKSAWDPAGCIGYNKFPLSWVCQLIGRLYHLIKATRPAHLLSVSRQLGMARVLNYARWKSREISCARIHLGHSPKADIYVEINKKNCLNLILNVFRRISLPLALNWNFLIRMLV